MRELRERLLSLSDAEYREFSSSLIPNVPKSRFIGVRSPELKELARELYKSGKAEEFMSALPHAYYEEDMLHALLIGHIKDFSRCIDETDRFLPYVDNWAVCDSLRPPVFRKHRAALMGHVKNWINSGHCYTCRFGIGMLMCHYLDEDFQPDYLWLAVTGREEYYVRMMSAWYFATALSKQYEAALPFIQEGRLPLWVHNKAIQKALESRRVNSEHKTYLKTLKKRG